MGHTKYVVGWTREKFLERAKTAKIAITQLNATKLERLMDRYAGKEWLPSKLIHLDDPESEKADVLRGLNTFAQTSPEHAKAFAEQYAKQPKARQVLDEKTVKVLSGK